jgi:capping protein alpha
MSDEESDYEEATPEQKLNIATYFIMSSPTGEVAEVISDVKKLVNDDSVLSNDALSKILANYNSETLASAVEPEGTTKILTCAAGRVSDTTFLNPSTGQVVTFDHIARKFTGVTDSKQTLDDDVASYRTALEKSINTYISGNYGTNKCAAGVYGANSGELTVCISAENVNLRNFWTGGWRGIYTVNVKEGKATLNGTIKTNVHYFEDGNVQLHTAINKTASISIESDTAATASSIVKAIDRIETDFQTHLEEMYVEMHRTTFKAMRRFFPISGQLMNWNSNAHKMASEVSK